jgi:sugar lactone lactonase YvrE
MNVKTALEQNIAGLSAILHKNRVMGTLTALFLFASLLSVPASYATTYTLTSSFGPSFGSVTLTRATGVAVDAAGNIYIANAENSKIVKIDPNGNLLQTFCASFFECNDPLAVSVDGSVYVGDQNHQRIIKFDSAGNFVQQFTRPGLFPLDIVVDAAGNVYTTDLTNQQVVKFDPSGNVVLSFGSLGSVPGQFNTPSGIALDTSGNIYVADKQNTRAQKFDPSGNFLQIFDVIDATESVAVDSAGNVYVIGRVGGGSGGVVKFDPAGNFLTQITASGALTDTAVSPSGNIVYATDASNIRVLIFTLSSDTTPPVLTLPSPITAEATGAAGATVTYSATANDNVDGPIAPTCSPASGTTFPIATTTVTCTATDAAGNTATGSFMVTVQDTTAPSLTVPANIVVTAASSAGTVVTYSASATDLVDGTVTPACTPASGSTFPIGNNTVSCTATDSRGNTATKTFKIVVQPVFTILEPINADGSSIFKLGSTVPIKFQLQDASGNIITNIPAELRVAKISDGIAGTEMEAVSTSQADTGSTFRIQGNQYVYNWGTSSLSEGTWAIKIYLNYGQQSQLLLDNDNPSDGITVTVSLKP